VLAEIAHLGIDYAPAVSALAVRRDEAESHIVTGEVDSAVVHDLVALNRALGMCERTVGIFESLRLGTTSQRRARRIILPLIIEELVNSKSYSSILSAVGDAILEVDFLLSCHAKWRSHCEAHAQPAAARVAGDAASTLRLVACYYEALVALGHHAESDRVLQMTIAALPALDVRSVLGDAEARARQPT